MTTRLTRPTKRASVTEDAEQQERYQQEQQQQQMQQQQEQNDYQRENQEDNAIRKKWIASTASSSIQTSSGAAPCPHPRSNFPAHRAALKLRANAPPPSIDRLRLEELLADRAHVDVPAFVFRRFTPGK